jgi:hypothetical protein
MPAMGAYRRADAAIDPTNQIRFQQHMWPKRQVSAAGVYGKNYQNLEGIGCSAVEYYSIPRNHALIPGERPPGQDFPDF